MRERAEISKRRSNLEEEMLQDYLSKLDRAELLPYIFHPRKDNAVPPSENIGEKLVPIEDDIKVGLRFHFCSENDAPSILFFHGNGEIASDYDEIGPIFNRFGFGLIVSDYRGYGCSTGEPTVSSALSDSQIIFEYVKKTLNEQGRKGPIILMGRSLGSVPALYLAAMYNEEIGALILDSAFANIVDLLKQIGVPDPALEDIQEKFHINLVHIQKVTRPTLIIHGQYDQLIPLRDVESLMSYSQAKKKHFIVIPGAGHNDIIEKIGEAYFQLIRDFVMGTRRRSRKG